MTGEPICIGPFGDARDCPVHAPALRPEPSVPVSALRALLDEMARALGPSWPPNFCSGEQVHKWGKTLQALCDAQELKP